MSIDSFLLIKSVQIQVRACSRVLKFFRNGLVTTMPRENLSSVLSFSLLLICLSTSLTVGWISYKNSKVIIEAQTFDRLTELHTAKTAEIERYSEQIANQIHL